MGYENLNKVFVPRVLPIVKEAIIALRKSHAWTVRPCQWHVTRGDHTVEKKLWGEGVSLDVTEGMVATTIFNASHQTS